MMAIQLIPSTLILRKPLTTVKPYGLGDVVVRNIEAYFTKLVSEVHVSGELSETIPMRSSVPQGSISGLLLFLLFVNDLPISLEALPPLFAVDVKMVTRRAQKMRAYMSTRLLS